MKLLDWKDPRTGSLHRVALFGNGLVGSAIVEALRRDVVEARVRTLPYDWADRTARALQAEMIEAELVAEPAEVAGTQVDVIWTAGRSGFGSDDEAMAVETALLGEVLAVAERVEHRLPEARHTRHVISSAGGLFEGQTFCGAKAEPSPMRAYGRGKLAQEAKVLAQPGPSVRRIYRPSSVFGFRSGSRLGLISVLISDALAGRTTSIFGRSDTIRDYVLAEDIGRFVARQVLVPGHEAQRTFLLANGRPSTMFEIIARVQDLLQHPLLLRYDTAPDNAMNMSFRPSALDQNWHPTDLETGIRLTAAKIWRARLQSRDPEWVP